MIRIKQHKIRKKAANSCSNCNSIETIKESMQKPSYDYLTNLLKENNQSYSLKKDISNFINLHKKDFIFIKHEGTYEKIMLENILILQSEKNYLTLITTQKEFRFRSTIKNFITKLPTDFIKTHRSFIVNSSKIEKFDQNLITITGNIKIPISSSNKEIVITRLKQLLEV